MAKHKEIKMWAACYTEDWGGVNPRIETAQVRVVETPKQFRLVKDGTKEFRIGLRACCHRSTISKTWEPKPLHDTKKSALVTLHDYCARQVRLAQARERHALKQHNFATAALENLE